jgi:hypothetical protein
MTIAIIVGVGIAAFIGGILVGRKNKALVEAELAKVKELAIKAGVKL